MKKRITLDLPVETIKYIKKQAKAQKITASQFVENAFREFIANEEAENKLKKVS
ncbi:MAG: DUF6364 family protein [Bacteroidota bacterium]